MPAEGSSWAPTAGATLAAPANLRYSNVNDDLLEDFYPGTFRWKTDSDPDQIAGRFFGGLITTRVGKYIEPVFGSDPPGIVARRRGQPG